MKKIIFCNCLLIILFVSTLKVYSQNFNYSFTRDSSSYAELNNAQVLSLKENIQDKSFTIHLPFQFNFCGSICDSIIIENSSFIVFDKQKGLASIAFNNYGSKKDNTGNFVSSISFTTEGATSNRILKIQLKNIAQSTFCSTDYLSYQVWLYEKGNKIEYHIGPNAASLIPLPVFTPEMPAEERAQMEVQNPVLMGLLNRNMDSAEKAYLIKGSPSSLSGELISGDMELVYLNNIPAKGIILKLTPSF